MRILVCGGRKFSNKKLLFDTLDKFFYDKEFILIHGNAIGADSLADNYGKVKGLNIRVYPADWKKYKKAAGPIRNQQMLDNESPHLVIAFPGGTGTADMINRAKKANIQVIEIVEKPTIRKLFAK